MLSKTSITFFGCMMLFSTALGAELKLDTKAQPLNLRDAVTKTFEYNPELRAFSYQLKAQDGRALQASMAASPELNFIVEDAFGSGNYNSFNQVQTTISISWILEGDIRQGYIDVARAGTITLTTEATIRRLDVAAETTRLYLVSLANQTRLINADNAVRLAKQTVSAVSKRVEAGKSPEAELARAQAEVARTELALEDIEHQLNSSIRQLAAQWGNTNPGFKRVTGNIFDLPILASLETLKTHLDQNPEFSRLLSEKHLKQAELNLAVAQSSPEWRVNLGVRHFELSNDQALVAGITIPFGERSRNAGRIAEARANLSQTAAKEDQLRVRFETVLFVLYQELQHSFHRVDTYRNKIIPRLEKALQETRRAYNLGRYSYLELRSVQADLLEARTRLIEASIDAHLKVIEIERLTGARIAQTTTK